MKAETIFKNFFDQNPICNHLQSRFLVAVSGGVDSMVLLHLCTHYYGNRIGVAHVNYHLRGGASNEDENLVSSYCLKHRIPFYVKQVDPKDDFGIQSTGVQERARQIRYAYFKLLQHEYNYDYILTAHHQQDAVETLLLNLTRGAGINGAKAISDSNEKIFRPLLLATRSMIDAYAKENNILYREDYSNYTTKYDRNKIRLNVLPVLTEINKEANSHLFEFSQHMRSSEQIILHYFDGLKSKIRKPYFHGFLFDIESIMHKPDLAFYLYYLLADHALTKTQYYNMAEAVRHNKSGIQFETTLNQYCVHQGKLIQFASKPLPSSIDIELTNDFTEVTFAEHTITFSKMNGRPSQYKSGILYIDEKKIGTGLHLKSVEMGDYFRPFNLKGNSVLVNDYLNQKQIPLIAKPWVPILNNDSTIIGIIGIEVAYHCKVDKETECYWEIQIAKTISPA